jgi:hypothetical protein
MAGALFPVAANAAEQWIKLETPHFELYTTAGEKKGREAILYFEEVRSFFKQASSAKREEAPVRIVAFRSEGQYKPYRMNETSVAYYTQNRNHEYIVMQDIASENYPVAIHEYTHLIVQRDKLNLPLWLNEGWADFYSSLRPQGNKALVGALLPGRVQTLLTARWLDLPALASVDQRSPMYNERDKAGIFYAESWLLVHMLYLSHNYSSNFIKFVLAIANGQDTVQAFQSVYGKSLKEVTQDLNQYFRSNRFFAALYDVKLEKSAEEPRVSEVSAFDSDLILADLLSMVRKPDQARQIYEQLAKDNPARPEAEEALGYLSWQANDANSARQHFARAFAAGSKNAQMCFDYAMLEARSSAPGDGVVPILRRAVELDPAFTEARLRLGVLLTSQERYAEAREQLHLIQKVNPDQAPGYFFALGYADYRTNHLDDARTNGALAKKWAKTPAESEQADSLLRALDPAPAAAPKQAIRSAANANNDSDPPLLTRRDGPPLEIRGATPRNPFIQRDDQMKHVEGLAQNLDCSGAGARFHVLVGKTTMVFEIPDPTSVLIKHSDEAHHDFTCGPQKPFPVSVDYAVQPDPKKGTAGIVRELDF